MAGIARTIRPSRRAKVVKPRVPVPAATVSVPGGSASQAVALDNGLYDAYIQGSVASEWRSVFVVTGSYTITPASGDTAFTRARFWGPRNLRADTGDAVGAALTRAAIFSSKGIQAVGGQVISGQRMTRADRSAKVFPAHQGFIGGDPDYYYTIDTNEIFKRSRSDWSIVAQNLSPFTGLPTVGTAINHLGAGSYYGGELYIACEYWPGSCGSAKSGQQIAVYNASDLSLARTYPLGLDSTAEVGGVAIDAANSIAYVPSYCEPTIRRYALPNMTPLSSLAVSPERITSIQGLAVSGGLLYVSGFTPAADTGGRNAVIVLNADGQYVRELRPTDLSNAIEGLDFDVVSGRLGIINDNLTDTSYVDFYDIPASPSYAKDGWTNAKDSYAKLIGTPSLTDFTVFGRYKLTSVFNFNTLWDSTANANLFEGWVAGTGTLNSRVLTFKSYAAGYTAGSEFTFGYAYEATGFTPILYADGAARVTSAESGAQAWAANADICVGGGQNGNTLGDWLCPYFYLFNRKLTEAEMQALEASPGRIFIGTNAFTAAEKAIAAAA